MLHEIGRAGEEDRVATFDQRVPDRGCDVGLADAARAEDEDVAAVAYPAVAGCERVELRPIHARRERDIEARQRLAGWQPRCAPTRRDAALVAFGGLMFEQRLKEARMAPARFDGLGAEVLPEPRDRRQSQDAQERGDRRCRIRQRR